MFTEGYCIKTGALVQVFPYNFWFRCDAFLLEGITDPGRYHQPETFLCFNGYLEQNFQHVPIPKDWEPHVTIMEWAWYTPGRIFATNGALVVPTSNCLLNEEMQTNLNNAQEFIS